MSNIIIQGLGSVFLITQGYTGQASGTGDYFDEGYFGSNYYSGYWNRPSHSLTATLTGPTSGSINSPSANFFVTLNGFWTGTIIMDDGGAGGVFTPTELVWVSQEIPQSFTYTPSEYGNIQISISVKT